MGNRHYRLAGVCAITALVLFLSNTSCSSTSQPSTPPPMQATLPAPEFVSGTPGSVFINPKSQAVEPASQIKVSIEVVPAGWGISAVEVQVSFDPKRLEAVSVKPGSALGANPIEGTSKIDNAKGTIIYALARQGETTAPGARGVLANLEFRGKSGASGTTKIELTKVGLSDENFQAIAGVTSDGASIVFP